MVNSIRTTSNTLTATLANNQVTLDMGYVLVCSPFSPLRQGDHTLTIYPQPRQNKRHAKRKSYFKKYRATRQPNQSKARGNK